MTTFGAWTTGGSNSFRVGYDNTFVSGNQLYVWIHVQNQYNVSGDAVTLSWSGSFAGSVGATLTAGAGGDTQILAQVIGTQAYNSTSTVTFTLSGLYTGPNATQTMVTALGPLAPNAPTGAGATYVSDTQVNTAWTNNPTADRPYGNLAFYRRDNTAPDTVISWLPGTQAAYNDTGVVADRKLAYIVTATNAAGATNSNTTNTVYTTPAAPTSAAAAKSGASDIAISWANASTYAAENVNEVGHAANGTWDAGLLVTTGAGAVASLHTAPSSAVTHQYRIRAVSPDGRRSAWAYTNVVTLATVPNPPVVTGPAVMAATEANSVTWSYSSADTAVQTSAQVRWRQQGTSPWTTVTQGTAAASYILVANTLVNGHVYEVQVAAQGVPAMGYSAWSATYLATTSARPTATITSTTPVQSTPIGVAWVYYDPEAAAQSGWEAEITTTAGAVLASGSGLDQSASWAPGLAVADASTGKRRVRVRDGAGLWSAWSEQSYTVVLDLPAVPTGTVTWNATTGAAVVSVLAGAGAGVPTVTLDVLRTDTYTGTAVTRVVATGLSSGQSVSDPEVPLTGSTYTVRAVSAYPSYASSAPLTVTVTGGYAYLTGAGRVARGLWNIEPGLADTWDRSVFQADGREYGLGIGTTSKAQTLSVTTDLDTGDGTSSHAEFLAVANGSLVCTWRDPAGNLVRGIVTDMRRTIGSETEAAVAFTLHRVDADG